MLLCGDKEHYKDDADEDLLVVVHHYHLAEKDRSLVEIMKKLSIDYTAERKNKNSEWIIYHDPDKY